jgi:hypothetical protein
MPQIRMLRGLVLQRCRIGAVTDHAIVAVDHAGDRDTNPQRGSTWPSAVTGPHTLMSTAPRQSQDSGRTPTALP